MIIPPKPAEAVEIPASGRRHKNKDPAVVDGGAFGRAGKKRPAAGNYWGTVPTVPVVDVVSSLLAAAAMPPATAAAPATPAVVTAPPVALVVAGALTGFFLRISLKGAAWAVSTPPASRATNKEAVRVFMLISRADIYRQFLISQ
jgi:hypothetical protein